jgi:hypothetical protein
VSTTRRREVEHPKIAVVPREEFLQTMWDYRAGEHVTFLGPTKSGKTTLGYQLLEHAATEKVPVVVLVMKPRDPVAASWSKQLGYRTVRSWPPFLSTFQPRKPAGWTLWPKHTFDPKRDNPMLHREFRKCILDCYKRGNRIIFGDEVYGLVAELGLSQELIAVWSRGRSMGAGLWAATQKPTHIPLWAYSQAEHLFLHHDPDKRARDRFKEIGGVDPDWISSIVMGLSRHQWLYIRQEDKAMCIVDK